MSIHSEAALVALSAAPSKIDALSLSEPTSAASRASPSGAGAARSGLVGSLVGRLFAEE